MHHSHKGRNRLWVLRACALEPDTPEFESWSHHFLVGWLWKFLKTSKPQFTHLEMRIVTSPSPSHMVVLWLPYDSICEVFSTMLAVVVILLLITHQIPRLKHLFVLPHSIDMQINQGLHTKALARILQGGIIIRSVSKLKRSTECVEGLHIFELTGKEEGWIKESI